MFKVEFFVDDHKLGAALTNLVGLAKGQPSVVPVINAMEKNGHIKAIGEGTVLDLFSMYLKKTKQESINNDDIRAFLQSIGRSPGSANYVVKLAIAQKLMKRTGKSAGVRYFPAKD